MNYTKAMLSARGSSSRSGAGALSANSSWMSSETIAVNQHALKLARVMLLVLTVTVMMRLSSIAPRG